MCGLRKGSKQGMKIKQSADTQDRVHLFLTALSVRPGSFLAMVVHLLPMLKWPCSARRVQT